MVNYYSKIDDILEDAQGLDLYHYTSFEGLEGILEKRKIRCTQIFYLNDLEENIDAWRLIAQVIKELNDEGELNKISSHYNHNISDLFLETLNGIDKNYLSQREIDKFQFVFSLTNCEDDLNQWRSYCPEGFGFAIKFNFEDFNHFKLNQKGFEIMHPYKPGGSKFGPFPENNCKILLKKCIYSFEEKKIKIRNLLKSYQDENKNIIYMGGLLPDLYTLSAFFKNTKFEREEECRIIVNLDRHKEPLNFVSFRKGRNFIVPYIELSLSPDLIKKVQIGPTPFKNHSANSVSWLIKKAGFNNLSLSISEIPLRSW